MTSVQSGPASRNRTESLALWAILAVGFTLRAYHLETPSMWWDEILVPLTARFPVPYILQYSLTQECHPPFFYLLTKQIMAMGHSDFALRAFPFCLGVLAPWLAYRVGKRLLDPVTGLFAAALAAATPLFVFISREARPYTAFLVLFLLSLPPLLDVLTGRRRRLPLLAALNAGMFLAHYMTVLVVACQTLLAVLFRLRRNGLTRWRDVIALGAAGGLSMLPVLPFFIGGVLSRPDMAGASVSMAATFHEFSHNIMRGVNILAAGPIFHGYQTQDATALLGLAATLALAGLGGVTLYRENRNLFLVCLVFTVFPILLLTAIRQEFSRPWYVLFVPAVFLYPVAAGLARLVRSERAASLAPATAVVLCLGLAASVWVRQGDNFYRPDSYPDPYKSVALALPEAKKPGGQTVFSNQDAYNAINWYVDRFRLVNPLAGPPLSPSDAVATVEFLSLGDFGVLAKNEAGFLDRFGSPTAVYPVSRAKVYRFDVARAPVTMADRLPQTFRFDASPLGFYRTVHACSGVTLYPQYETSVIAARNDAPGFVEYAFAPVEGLNPGRIVLFARTINFGEQNRIACRYRFDDEPWSEGFVSLGPDSTVLRRMILMPPPGFRRLLVRIEIVCARKTPRYPGGNLDSARFVDLTARFDAGE
ncbi:hypothetical protein JCM15519_34720 [Fundidesulfovibrio butyratiphilus]